MEVQVEVQVIVEVLQRGSDGRGLRLVVGLFPIIIIGFGEKSWPGSVLHVKGIVVVKDTEIILQFNSMSIRRKRGLGSGIVVEKGWQRQDRSIVETA
jgi:hypothetical protein